jgi:hypothetical protein
VDPDLNPDSVSGQILKRDVCSLQAELNRVAGADIQFRSFLYNNHTNTFHSHFTPKLASEPGIGGDTRDADP